MGWHIVVTEEMRALGLSGNDLMVYALINGFSQNGQGCYYGSLPYICETCGISRRTAIYILNDLVENKFLSKTEVIQNGVKRVLYKVCTGSAEIAPEVVQKLHRGSAEIAPNNIYDNKYIDIECNKGKPKFCKPTIPEIESYCRERGNTIDAEEFFNFYESKGWVIGKSPMKDWKACIRTWERNKRQSPSAPQAAPRKRSVLDNNREVAEQLMRMSMMTEDTI